MSIYRLLRRLYAQFEEKKKTKYLDNLISHGLKLGKNVEIISDYFFDPSHCYLITIEDNCTICPAVRLIAHDASTFRALGYTKMGRITIKKGCFIGDSTTILPNVTIGENCIIGSGSVVTKSIPDNMVAAGNPAVTLMSVDDYINKIKEQSKDKKIFGKEYHIHNLTKEKRQEILDAVEDSTGFIV